MLIDSFLFFQELDLLEIRLEYLYPFVDKFIIVESNQNFKGNSKLYNFEFNIKRYKKYLDKIEYFKIEDKHNNYSSLLEYLGNTENHVYKKIDNFIKKHNYYDKKNLFNILDSYHRECIHLPLNKFCNDNDIIIISDLDEIPSYRLLDKIKKQREFQDYLRLEQYEFQYYLNCYSNTKWLGSLITKYGYLKNKSLNSMRRSVEESKLISYGGYHFTSIGDPKTILNKIESWAHQEFNKPLIKNNIEKNITHGKDIFYRFRKERKRVIKLEKIEIFDKRITEIIKNYDNLLINKIQKNYLYDFEYKFNQMLFLFKRILNNPLKAIIKLKNLFFL